MFDLANYFASTNTNNARMTLAGSKSSSSDETASTSSLSSDSTPDTTDSSRSRGGGGCKSQAKQHKHKNEDSPKNNASNTNDEIDDDDDEVVHIPPKIAFQIFELIELKRRCKGLYRRHQEKRRQSVIRANHSSYHSFTYEFESYCIDGELFV